VGGVNAKSEIRGKERREEGGEESPASNLEGILAMTHKLTCIIVTVGSIFGGSGK